MKTGVVLYSLSAALDDEIDAIVAAANGLPGEIGFRRGPSLHPKGISGPRRASELVDQVRRAHSADPWGAYHLAVGLNAARIDVQDVTPSDAASGVAIADGFAARFRREATEAWWCREIVRRLVQIVRPEPCPQSNPCCRDDGWSQLGPALPLCPDCESLMAGTDWAGLCRIFGSTELRPLEASAVVLPLMQRLAATQKREGVSLRDYSFVFVLHFLRDLLGLFDAFRELGALPERCTFLCKPYPYPDRDKVTKFLFSEGCQVFAPTQFGDMDTLAKELTARHLAIHRDVPFIVVEDGGYVGPWLHEDGAPEPAAWRGVVEQTTRGDRKWLSLAEQARIRVPVLSLAGSRFKAEFEAPLVGKAVVQNIRALLRDHMFDGKLGLVVGFGAIGRAVAFNLNSQLGMTVAVAEPDPVRRLYSRLSPFVAQDFATARECAGHAHMIVGTSGTTVLSGAELESLDAGVYLVSASSDQVEFDVAYLRSRSATSHRAGAIEEFSLPGGKTLNLIAEGYPINFYGAESVPNQSIDPIMSLLFLCAAKLASCELRPGRYTGLVDDLVKSSHLAELFMEIHANPT